MKSRSPSWWRSVLGEGTDDPSDKIFTGTHLLALCTRTNMLRSLLLYGYISSTAALLPAVPSTTSGHGKKVADFDWDNVTSHTYLNWQKCYDDFECTRLTVPADWNDAKNPNNISLPLIRLPAKVPSRSPHHGGTILTNPGGPGGSGVWWATENAARLQRQLRSPNREYAILSFDPRGIFHSKPNAYCFESAVEAEIFASQREAVGSLTGSEYALKFNWVAERALGEVCEGAGNGRFADGDNVRRYVSTASVATDMLRIIELLDKEDRSPGRVEGGAQKPLGKGRAKLQYFGTSYGTLLGQTFAAMYPGRVHRMVLDSNVDPDNWVSRYEAGIDDHGAAREYFFERCFAAKTECAFHRGSDKSPQDVQQRYDDLLDSLEKFPRYAHGEGRAMPITRARVEDGFMTTTYQPTLFFKPFAIFLNDLLSDQNPGIPFFERAVPTQESFINDRGRALYQGSETGLAVQCSDGPYLSDEPLSAFEDYLGNLTESFGRASAGIQAAYKIGCWTWPKSLRTKWRFDGPFEGNASILFINNRLDPATAAKNARKMAKRFVGSGMLEQNAVGHGAMWPAQSECVEEHVREYMDSGRIPEVGTICQPRCQPFDGDCDVDE